jgi:tetratricopeptide (TPR) repeat protein
VCLRKPAVLLDRAHAVLTPEAALAQGKWATTEWAPTMTNTELKPEDRARAVLIVARVHLFLGEYRRALEHFEEAGRMFPSIGTWAVGFLTVQRLPRALAEPKDAHAYFVLAQVFRIFGQYVEAGQQVDRALDLGFSGENYPDAPARQFKAELLEMAGERQEAAGWFYEAGRRFSWRGEQDQAIGLLKKAAELKPDKAAVYWYWMDAARMASGQPEPPFVNLERVSEAARAWESGVKVSYPASGHTWAYLSRALLSLQFAALPGEDRVARWWGAVVLTEASLVLRESEPFGWTLLARLCRFLRKNANALEITQHALAEWPDDVAVLDERGAILANVGDFQQAEEIIDRRRALEPNNWADAVKAFVLLKTERGPAALDLLNAVIAPEESTPGSGSIWYRQLRAEGCLQYGRAELAEPDLRWIRERYTPLDRDNQFAFGWAAYKLNELEFASSIFAALRADRGDDPSVAYRYLGLCDLARGELRLCGASLSQSLSLASDHRDLNDLLRTEFSSLERSASGRPDSAELLAIVKRLPELTEAKQAELQRQPRSPEQELKMVVAELERDGQAGGCAWVGAQAGLARLAAGQKQWSEAASRYVQLVGPECRFPAARQALERAADGLGQVGFNYFDSNDLASARAAFLEALQHYRKAAADAGAGKRLGRAILSIVANVARYWDVQDALRAFSADAEIEEGDRHELGSARDALEFCLVNWFGLSQNAGENVNWLPSVNPILVELEVAWYQGTVPKIGL